MTTFEASLVVTGLDLGDEVQLERLEALDFLALPAEIDGQIEVEVEVEAPSAAEAWARIRVGLRRTGVVPTRVSLDLVGISDIATRLDVNRETVRLWAVGKRREGFPLPFDRAAQSPIWRWSDIADWASTQDDLTSKLECMPLASDLVDSINGILSRRRNPAWKRPSANVISIEAHRRKRSAGKTPGSSKWTPTHFKIG